MFTMSSTESRAAGRQVSPEPQADRQVSPEPQADRQVSPEPQTGEPGLLVTVPGRW